MELQLTAQRTLPRPTYNHERNVCVGSYNDVRSFRGHFIRLSLIKIKLASILVEVQ